MFDDPITCPCAVADGACGDREGDKAALTWCVEKMTVGEKLTVWVPQKNTLHNNSFLEMLSRDRQVVLETGRGGGSYRAQGPVLAFYPDAAELADICATRGMTALAVLTWSAPLLTWAEEVNAETVGPWTEERPSAPVMDADVVAELELISQRINHSNSIGGGGYDKRDVVQPLMKLHEAGHRFDPQAMTEWAVAHGWRGDNPKYLGQYAEKINRGSRLRW